MLGVVELAVFGVHHAHGFGLAALVDPHPGRRVVVRVRSEDAGLFILALLAFPFEDGPDLANEKPPPDLESGGG